MLSYSFCDKLTDYFKANDAYLQINQWKIPRVIVKKGNDQICLKNYNYLENAFVKSNCSLYLIKEHVSVYLYIFMWARNPCLKNCLIRSA